MWLPLNNFIRLDLFLSRFLKIYYLMLCNLNDCFGTEIFFCPNLCEWWASRRCQSARLSRCCSCAPGLLFGWSTSPQAPAVPPLVSVTEARWQKWSARKPMGSSDLASTIFRMAPHSSSPTPACERNSLSASAFATLLSGSPGGVAPDRRFSLSAITGTVTWVAATEAEAVVVVILLHFTRNSTP